MPELFPLIAVGSRPRKSSMTKATTSIDGYIVAGRTNNTLSFTNMASQICAAHFAAHIAARNRVIILFLFDFIF